MAENANTIWADGPSGEPYQPEKSRIRAWGTWLEENIGGRIAATRTALKAVDTDAFQVMYLAEAGRQGSFSWKTGDFSTLIAADPQEGIYIEADDIAATAGAWVRQDGGWLFGDMRAEWFGFVDSTDGATTAATNQTAIQAALNLRYHLRGGIVRYKGFGYFSDFLAIPASCFLEGDIRHNVLLEYGDTTGGVDHPNTGSVLHTYGAGTARLWTDESGTGSDTPIKVAIAVLGENAGVRNMTLQTPTTSDAWDVGIHICGVSRGSYEGLDVRGAWKKDAIRLDATWSRTSTNMLATAFLPSWFTADYKAIYDFGLTNNYFEQCRFEGGGALAVEGGPNVALSTNGISDTVFIACEFYNEQSATTKATRTGVNGHLIRLNYRITGLGGAQGLSFIGCRFDAASRWVFDFDYWSNVDLVQRCFVETSAAYVASQTTDGAPTEQLRGRIRTTTNTCTQTGDVLRFCGEFFCNLSTANSVAGDNAANGTPITWVPRAEAGKRITFETGAYRRTFDELTDGEVGTSGYFIRSWATAGRINLQKMTGNAVDTWGYLANNENSWGTAYDQKWGAGTVTFQRNSVTFLSYNGTNIISLPIYSDTTANAANVNIESDGRARRSTSALKYKTNVQPIPDEMLDALLKLRGVLYTSLCSGDDQDQLHMGSIADEAAELGLEPLVVRGEDGEVEDFKYGRAFSALLEVVKRQEARLKVLET
ncbi:tail fiber domain-containing protein [Rhizobium sp. CC1099]|uniref:tail fiber domain-containing protein n=1 Tax=Rhizobium sp. CC1099 TaxID=3039160 RepID=UPI0024B12825|nr:tail fiber domain-containing protein [Rhizobium sp. CC1099]WFU88996.1 tail fiber domain-containing protein [Rhizobium sp. CC1099]